MCGNAATHGGHQVAQKSTKTTLSFEVREADGLAVDVGSLDWRRRLADHVEAGQTLGEIIT